MRLKNLFIVVCLFAIAMAFLESAIVVYLRELYYPEGFDFPLRSVPVHIAVTEFFREVATLVMLAGIGYMAGKRPVTRFAWFLFSFAIWDIFYYVFLYVLIGWPQSLFTWDILFLVPFVWVGPVIAPVINSLMMIVLAVLIIRANRGVEILRIQRLEWLLLALGSVVVIAAFTEEYISFMNAQGAMGDLLCFRNSGRIIELTSQYCPQRFAWQVFIAGIAMHATAILRYFLRAKKSGLLCCCLK
ncbi:MAG: hypothetical protein KKA07_01655 [Bacteroidetes bacterium]|nr:hypothetical protein [Bacteroidota bacterium]MBU1717755.1 hypothetical protein [Bacteroidota bacterium]